LLAYSRSWKDPVSFCSRVPWSGGLYAPSFCWGLSFFQQLIDFVLSVEIFQGSNCLWRFWRLGFSRAFDGHSFFELRPPGWLFSFPPWMSSSRRISGCLPTPGLVWPSRYFLVHPTPLCPRFRSSQLPFSYCFTVIFVPVPLHLLLGVYRSPLG